jgi:hypothetical protein
MDMVYVYVRQSVVAKAKKAERTLVDRVGKEQVKTATSNSKLSISGRKRQLLNLPNSSRKTAHPFFSLSINRASTCMTPLT